jgi:hypothetical protein
MYHAQGWVTDASENYEDLIGCKFFEKGTVYFENVENLPGVSWTGYGSGFIGP